MENMYQEGKIRAIGVSNFDGEQLEALNHDSRVKVMVNQIEYHPDFEQDKIARYSQSHDIAVEVWSPLGGPDSHILGNKYIRNLAEKYDKGVAQIVLRWHVQNSIIPIPKSTSPEHMEANLDIFDFKLSDEEMAGINELNQGVTYFDPETYHS